MLLSNKQLIIKRHRLSIGFKVVLPKQHTIRNLRNEVFGSSFRVSLVVDIYGVRMILGTERRGAFGTFMISRLTLGCSH